jgi:TolB-like protein
MESNIITPDMVRGELCALLQCEELNNSPVLSRFLEYVVEKKLLGQEDEIKEYTIGVLALGRPVSFNPQLDAIVRIHAGRLRRIISAYYLTKGKSNLVGITIPKGAYVPSFDWRQSADLSVQQGSGAGTEALVANNDQENKDYWFKRPVIAIFPFHNYSADDTRDYFARGMGEQLSIDLAHFQNISILSYFTTFKYKDNLNELPKLRTILGFDYVLTGSVRFSDDVLRLNLQLITAENCAIIWTETYEYQLAVDNLFEIQQEITDEVLNIIAGDNGVIIRRNFINPALLTRSSPNAQDAIYRYYDFATEYSLEKHARTLEALEEVHRQEPDNALICAMVADMHLYSCFSDVNADQGIYRKATELATKAIQLDAQCQHAQKSMAWSHLLEGKIAEGIVAANRCVSINQKESAMISSMGLVLLCLGDFVSGYNLLVRSMQLSRGILPTTKFGLALYHFYRKSYLVSLKWMGKLTLPNVHMFSMLTHAIMGKLPGKIMTAQAGEIALIEDNAALTMNLWICDPPLKAQIFDGLRLSGFNVRK